VKMPPQSQSSPRVDVQRQRQRIVTLKTKGIDKISLLGTALAIGIFLFATAPIFIHHSMVHPINNAPHQFPRPHASSLRIGKTKSATIETIKYQLSNGEDSNFVFEDEHASNVTFPPNIGRAGRALLLRALQKRSIWDDELDPEIETDRCRKYFSYRNSTMHFPDYKGRKRRRRVFLGSLIADDSWHALAALAIETYGIYTAVAFVEGNRTQTGSPRKLRFTPGTLEHKILVESNLFGPNTPVLMDHFSLEDDVDGGGLIREHMQRNLIIDLWKKAGMTPDDVGVLTDADETLTRDFLRAVQTCEMPQLNPETQNCHTAKVIASSQVFEGSPECMATKRKWMHPDVILGKCIEGIGDDEFKLKDSQRQRKFAWRRKPYTQKFANYSGWPKDKKTFPLWNPADFRRDQGGHEIFFEHADYLPFKMGHTGFHFHNYFGTTKQLRKKYMTYGHPVKDAEGMSVSEMHPDLDVMVDCVLGRSTTNNKHSTLNMPLKEFEGRLPIAYGIEGYTMERHSELYKILSEDEIGHKATWHDTQKSKDWYENIPD